MRARPLGLVVLVLLAALAGCVGTERAPDERAPVVEDAVFAASASPLELVPPADPPLLKRPLEVALVLQDAWVRPRQGFEAVAETPAGAVLSWFVTTDGADAFVERVGDFHYVGGALSPTFDAEHSHAPPPHVPIATGALEPGESAVAPRFTKHGRYVVALDEDARASVVNLTVTTGAPRRDTAHVTLVEDEHGLRFSPSEMTLHPATRVRFWNGAAAPHAFVEARYLAPAGEGEPRLDLIAVHPGNYTLVALAREGADGWGEATARFVIDFDSPPARLGIGPFSGRVSPLDTPDAPSERVHRFTVLHPLRALRFDLAVESTTPVPGSATWTLVHENETRATAPGDASDLELSDLPPGDYALSLRADDGFQLAYEARGIAWTLLRAPAASDSS